MLSGRVPYVRNPSFVIRIMNKAPRGKSSPTQGPRSTLYLVQQLVDRVSRTGGWGWMPYFAPTCTGRISAGQRWNATTIRRTRHSRWAGSRSSICRHCERRLIKSTVYDPFSEAPARAQGGSLVGVASSRLHSRLSIFPVNLCDFDFEVAQVWAARMVH